MATEVEFGLLGPLTVRCDGAMVAVPPGKQRAVLAALLLSAGNVVSLDDLVETVWGPDPPPTARVGVQNYVMRLRKALSVTGPALISTQPGGYLIGTQAGQLDVTRFETLLGTAHMAAQHGSWETSATHAGAALALWRGEPLTGVGSESLERREVPRLTEMRLQALETRIDADLRLGRHRAVIAEVQRLVSAHPLREHLHALLMLALYLDSRQGEALAAYRRARKLLVDELGAEPGDQLRGLHQMILAGDPALAGSGTPRQEARPTCDGPGLEPAAAVLGATAAGSAGAGAAKADAGVVPRQLPTAVAHFAGRQPELRMLSDLLTQRPGPAGTVMITAIGGMAGVGKTALAVHWAHQVAGQFPDGQLYVNLRGYDVGPPVLATDALAGFLRALGLTGLDIPGEVDERAALFRSLLAGRRILVVLDNAGQAEQVRPLLPGSPTCVTVVTSRNALAGLVARDGAARLEVGLLPLPEAVGLLGELIGSRAADDPAAVVTLAGQCCRLPLALRIAAERAVARPNVPLADLVAELANLRQRLDALETCDDERTAVRAVFSWSYQQLSAETAGLFRLLGLHPGPDITIAATASMAGIPLWQARQALRQLAVAHLVTEHAAGRYSLHDLLRAYSAEQATERESEAERHAAIQRMLDHYLHTANTAALLLDPSREPVTLAPARPAVESEHLASDQQALAWLEAEHQVLISVVSVAAETGFDVWAWQLAWAMTDYLDWHGHWQELAAIQRTALVAATRLGDTAGQAVARCLLARAQARLGDYGQARAHLTDCLSFYRQLGDSFGEARVHQSLGGVAMYQGWYPGALAHAEQALALFRTTGHRAGQAGSLSNAGWCHALLGDYLLARTFCWQALAMNRDLGDRSGEAGCWDILGYAEHKLGNLAKAADYLRRALGIFRDLGDRYEQAEILTHLGDVHQTAGEPLAAAHAWQQALDILDGLHHPDAAQVRARLHRPRRSPVKPAKTPA